MKLEILRADRSWSNESKGEGSQGCIADDSGRILLHLYTSGDFNYAELIVKAVNSYEGNQNTIDGLKMVMKRQEELIGELITELQAMHSQYLGKCKGGCPTLELLERAKGLDL